MKTYIFKVKLRYDKRIWRKIEMLGSQTLNDLHMAIQEAFDFDADHLYSFFMSGKAWDLSNFEYHHPEADGGPEGVRMRAMILFFQGSRPEPRLPATGMRIESLSLKPTQRFLYLFDYGDEWQFEVEFLKEGSSEKALYPRIIDSRGEAPQQYQDWDEEED